MNGQPLPPENPVADAESAAVSLPPALPSAETPGIIESSPNSNIGHPLLPLLPSTAAAPFEPTKKSSPEHFGADFFFEIGEIFITFTVLFGGLWFYGSEIKTLPSSVQTLAWWGPTLMILISLAATGGIAWRYHRSGKSVSNWIVGPLIFMLICGGMANMGPTFFTISGAFGLGDRWGLGDLAVPVNLLWGGLVLIVCGLIQALALLVSIWSLGEFRRSNAVSLNTAPNSNNSKP
jgi:hypothetical protein